MALSVFIAQDKSPGSMDIVTDVVVLQGLSDHYIEKQGFWGSASSGYRVIECFFRYEAVRDIWQEAMALIKCLWNLRNGRRKAPIVFAAHSFSGIVLKRALLLALTDASYGEITESTLGVIFIETCHRSATSEPLRTTLESLETVPHALTKLDTLYLDALNAAFVTFASSETKWKIINYLDGCHLSENEASEYTSVHTTGIGQEEVRSSNHVSRDLIAIVRRGVWIVQHKKDSVGYGASQTGQPGALQRMEMLATTGQTTIVFRKAPYIARIAKVLKENYNNRNALTSKKIIKNMIHFQQVAISQLILICWPIWSLIHASELVSNFRDIRDPFSIGVFVTGSMLFYVMALASLKLRDLTVFYFSLYFGLLSLTFGVYILLSPEPRLEKFLIAGVPGVTLSNIILLNIRPREYALKIRRVLRRRRVQDFDVEVVPG